MRRFDWSKGGVYRAPGLRALRTVTDHRQRRRTRGIRRRPTLLNSPIYTPKQSPKMPTPESIQFRMQKPTVPPTFEGVDYDNNLQLKAAQDAVLREQWVQSMMARLLREEMGKCYYREGVNHLEKCGALRGLSFAPVHYLGECPLTQNRTLP
jgi:hypothetical protein